MSVHISALQLSPWISAVSLQMFIWELRKFEPGLFALIMDIVFYKVPIIISPSKLYLFFEKKSSILDKVDVDGMQCFTIGSNEYYNRSFPKEVKKRLAQNVRFTNIPRYFFADNFIQKIEKDNHITGFHLLCKSGIIPGKELLFIDLPFHMVQKKGQFFLNDINTELIRNGTSVRKLTKYVASNINCEDIFKVKTFPEHTDLTYKCASCLENENPNIKMKYKTKKYYPWLVCANTDGKVCSNSYEYGTPIQFSVTQDLTRKDSKVRFIASNGVPDRYNIFLVGMGKLKVSFKIFLIDCSSEEPTKKGFSKMFAISIIELALSKSETLNFGKFLGKYKPPSFAIPLLSAPSRLTGPDPRVLK